MRTRTPNLVCLAAAACLSSLPGCTPEVLEQLNRDAQGIADKGFVAKLDNPDALIGILIQDGEALAYVCDAVEGRSSISAWFEGGLAEDRLEMAAIVGTTYETTSLNASISAAVQEDAIRGVLKLDDGTEIAFTAMPAQPETAAGLYVDLDDEALTSAVVGNDNQLKGLSRLRNEGWTSRVTPAAPLTRGGSITVNFNTGQAVAVRRTIPVRRVVTELRPLVTPQPDAPPTGGDGTLMILAQVNTSRQVIGHRYLVERPDPIGVPTVKLTEHLSNSPARALQGFMRVQVIAESGAVLSGQYIDDPLHEFVEVPQSERGDAPYAWIRTEPVRNFLVAVPNMPRARRVVFTRFDSAGRPIRAGGIDLLARSLRKEQSRQQSATTNYDIDAMEYDTVHGNGPPQERFDLLILAEGYQNTNQDRQAFNEAVSNALQYLWTIPIYFDYQQKINVHTGFLPSVDAGTSTQGGPNPVDKDTVYQSYFDCNAVADCRLLTLTTDGRQFAFEVAQNAPGNYGVGSIDVIMVLVNDQTWAGAGGGKLFTVSAHPDSPEIASHEFGHSAIGLADEYESVYSDLAISFAQQKVNVSGPVVNRTDLKWIDLVHPSTNIPTQTDSTCVRAGPGDCTASTLPVGTVGMYEGAGYAACGSFRPTTWCIMRCSYTEEFCEVCRKAFRDTLGDPNGIFEAGRGRLHARQQPGLRGGPLARERHRPGHQRLRPPLAQRGHQPRRAALRRPHAGEAAREPDRRRDQPRPRDRAQPRQPRRADNHSAALLGSGHRRRAALPAGVDADRPDVRQRAGREQLHDG
jgi:hypothetical protein